MLNENYKIATIFSEILQVLQYLFLITLKINNNYKLGKQLIWCQSLKFKTIFKKTKFKKLKGFTDSFLASSILYFLHTPFL